MDASIADRFWSKVLRSRGCWLWQAALCSGRYGFFWLMGRNHYAHRVAYQLAGGVIRAGKLICHKCDVPRCVNPAHLFQGTPKDNVIDCVRKGRRGRTGARGISHPRSKLTPRNVRLIRSTYRPYIHGYTVPALAKRLGVSNHTIQAVLGRATWKDVK